MNFLSQPAVIFVQGVMRLGPLRVSVYGLFAAVGLVVSLGLSQRTAKMAGMAGEQIWDAGWFAVTAAFVISRLLLIARDWNAFRTIPMTVLSLPSFTYGGMGLTAAAVVVYVRWKRLPVLAAMDAWAPCAALLAGVLSLGHYFEGTDAGMPTSLPWGVQAPGFGRVQPVQLYGFAGAMVLLVVLLRMLRRPLKRGMVAGVSLVAGGLLAFLLAFVTQPVDWGGNAWLEPAQWIAIGAVGVGMILLWYSPYQPLSRERAALVLEHFVLGGGGPYEHEELEYMKSTDPLMIEVKERFLNLQGEFPATGRGEYCNEQGRQVLLDYARRLRSYQEPTQEESN